MTEFYKYFTLFTLWCFDLVMHARLSDLHHKLANILFMLSGMILSALDIYAMSYHMQRGGVEELIFNICLVGFVGCNSYAIWVIYRLAKHSIVRKKTSNEMQ